MPSFVYEIKGIRTGGPLVPRNDITKDLSILKQDDTTLRSALKSFYSALLSADDHKIDYTNIVELDVECCYLSGQLNSYFTKELTSERPAGAEIGKLVNMPASPEICAEETAVMVENWLVQKNVPTTDEGGWRGDLRLNISLSQQQDTSSSEKGTIDRPFLQLQRCILPLKSIKRKQ